MDTYRHSATVETSDTLRVQVPQQHRVAEVLLVVHLLEGEPGEHQVNVDAVEAKFDDRYEGVGDGSKVGDLVLDPQTLDERREVVFPENVSGRHAQGVDIRTLVVDTESVGTVGEDLPSDRLRHGLGHVLCDARLFDPCLHQVIESAATLYERCMKVLTYS